MCECVCGERDEEIERDGEIEGGSEGRRETEMFAKIFNSPVNQITTHHHLSGKRDTVYLCIYKECLFHFLSPYMIKEKQNELNN